MCGIYASVSKKGQPHPSQDLRRLLYNRGPDHIEESLCRIQVNDDVLRLSFTSTVLALRGGHVVKQPLTDSVTGSMLCWNGEAWRISQNPVEGNDSEAVLHLLATCTHDVPKLYSITAVLEVIRSISGPFAFVFFDKANELLYFGRDYLGRRSLLINVEDVTATVQFSSVSGLAEDKWKEIEADGIYVLSLSNKLDHPSLRSLPADFPRSTHFESYRFPWTVDVLTRPPVRFSFSACHLRS
jgi:asparagine synthetase B (glutamine-hydrolysing)